MRLKSVTLKGFKSFPERTRLDFGPGVSVVVGPNGSGKSNVTDAVLWAMGEQSPLAVRGQSMQDVIFGGGRGVQARSSAEVEIVLDNADGSIEVPLSEISIVRRLDRNGEGGYRLNGARCRLGDVIEVLSDTGLGKESHSVISQGRVEEIVTSKPRDRRLLIEEAAGLGKHRKRRRRAQLKLERTQENLDRALDIEREARTRLRPLKRQAEAAELHERLERQTLEARLGLARDEARGRAEELGEAEAHVGRARAARAEIEGRLQAMIDRRALAERALAERADRHDALARRLYDARTASERLQLRSEQVDASARALARRAERIAIELRAAEGTGERDPGGERDVSGAERVAALEEQVAALERSRTQELEEELKELHADAKQQTARVRVLEGELRSARDARERADGLVEQAREGSVWSSTWEEVRRVLVEGVQRIVAQRDASSRSAVADEVTAKAEQVARGVVEYALRGVRAAEESRERAEAQLRAAERALSDAAEQQRRTEWLIAQRREASEQGPLAVRRAQFEGELSAERRAAERLAGERAQRQQRLEQRRLERARGAELAPLAARLGRAIEQALAAMQGTVAQIESELVGDRAAGEEMAGELRACAAEEAEIQTELRAASETVTGVEVAAQRLRDQVGEAELELRELTQRLGISEADQGGEPDQGRVERLDEEQTRALLARVERLERRRAQLGPVNPLAQEEHAEAVAHVEEMELQRADLETALRELRGVIRETDRQIRETFQETFDAAAQNFAELVADLFPGGSGRLALVTDEHAPRPVLGGQPIARGELEDGQDGSPEAEAQNGATEPEDDLDDEEERTREEEQGVEIEITPAGKSSKRLSLLSGGEKSMTALAFLFAVFLARPCPFYILDEVEAALDDLNLDRFLALLRRYSERAQFIVITHQKRTMEAADWLYGVSMGADGVSKVISRRLPAAAVPADEEAEVA
jgi:chromosome segregation protein